MYADVFEVDIGNTLYFLFVINCQIDTNPVVGF